MKFEVLPDPQVTPEDDLQTTPLPRGERNDIVPEPADDPYVGAVLVERYAIERRLGAGGMSTVYLARNLSFGGYVAVKLLRPRVGGKRDALARCKFEAKTLASVSSNHIVRAHDVHDLQHGQICIVMEYLKGEDLNALLQREGPLPWRRAANMTRMICAGLAAAHKQNIIHRDIKPHNCFRVALDDNPDHIKLIDFGIAKDFSHGHENTQTGILLGTPDYLAPELIKGKQPDARSDIYAVGATLYKLLTGVVPFSGTNPVEVCNRHCNEAVVPPTARTPWLDISPEADRIVLRAMAKEPEQRYPSAQAMIADIEAALSRSPTGPLPALEQSLSEGLRDGGPRPAAPGANNQNESTGARKSLAAVPPARPAEPPSLIPQSSVEAPTEIENIVSRRETALKLIIPLLSALAFALVSWKLAPPAQSAPVQALPAKPAEPSPPASAAPPSPSSPPAPAPAEQPSQLVPEPPPSPPEASPETKSSTLEAETPESPSSPRPPSPAPEKSFDYASARAVLREQKRYFHNECMKRYGVREAELTVHVRKSGVVKSLEVTAERKSAAVCLKRLVKAIVFDPGPQSGAFLYRHPSGELEPLPPVEQPTPRGEP